MEAFFHRATTVLLGLSLVVNLALAWALRETRQEAAGLRRGLLIMKEEASLQVGRELPPLEGETADGSPWRLEYHGSGRPTLLYVYSSKCGWCARNLANIRHLGSEIAPEYRVVGISLSATPVELRAQEMAKLGFPVLFDLSADIVASYRLGTTPQTLLVSAEGALVKNWSGAYAQGLDREIEEHFGVDLPGLLEVETSPELG